MNAIEHVTPVAKSLHTIVLKIPTAHDTQFCLHLRHMGNDLVTEIDRMECPPPRPVEHIQTAGESTCESQNMDTISNVRTRIDRIDEQLVRLLDERIAMCKKIGPLKTQRTDDTRECAVYAHVSESSACPTSMCAIYRTIISECTAVQRTLGYLGPEGSFSHLAAKTWIGARTLNAYASICDVVCAVQTRHVTHGIVPISSTTGGYVRETMFALCEGGVRVVDEFNMDIRHSLYHGGRIDAVYSHPQAFAQCASWLDTRLPGVKRIATSSTSAGMALVKEPGAAAIGASGRECAWDIEETIPLKTQTRFVVITALLT